MTEQSKPDALTFDASPPTAALGYEPHDLRSAWKLATILVKSRFLPEAVQTPEQALAIMLTGRELGLTSMQAFRSIHVIKGKPTLSADLMVALVQRSPACEYFTQVASTNEAATYRTKRRDGGGQVEMTFTIADAKRAGLNGGNWEKFPAAMLRARCKSALARDCYPEALIGVYDPDELGGVEDSRPLVTETPHDPETGEVVEPRVETTSQAVQGMRRGRRSAAQDTPFGAGPVTAPEPLPAGWGGDASAQTAIMKETAERQPGEDRE